LQEAIEKPGRKPSQQLLKKEPKQKMENQVEMTQFLAMDEREEEMKETHCSLLQLTQAPTIDIQA